MTNEEYDLTSRLEESADNLKRAVNGIQHGTVNYGPSGMSEPANPAPIVFQLPAALTEGAEYVEDLAEKTGEAGRFDFVREALGRPSASEKARAQIPEDQVEALHSEAEPFSGEFTYDDFAAAVEEWDRVHDSETYERTEEPGEDFQPIEQSSRALEEVKTLQDRTPL